MAMLTSWLTVSREWRRKRGLQMAVVLSVAISLAVSALAGFLSELYQVEDRAREELRADLDRASEVLAASLSTPLWELSVSNGEAIVRSMVLDPRFVSIVVKDSATHHTFVESYRIAGAAPSTVATRKTIERGGREIGTVDAAMTLEPYIVVAHDRLKRNLMLMSIVLLLALTAIILILRKYLLTPIRLLTVEALRIADENLSTPVVSVGNNELGQVAEAMEQMRRRLLAAFDELQEKNRRSMAILEASPIPLAMIAGQGEITFLNNAFISTFGYPASEIPTLADWWRLAYPDARERQWFAQQWQYRMDNARNADVRFLPMELNIQCKDGSVCTVIGSATAVEENFSGSHLIALYDITERKRAEEQIKTLAFFDQLTGLANRTLLMDRLRQAMAASDRSRNYGALLFIDLDNFKALNDTFGHDMGDMLLKQLSDRLLACIREGDTVARLGGDEFVVMLTSLDKEINAAALHAEAIGNKILAALRENCRLSEIEHVSTASIGATLFCGHAVSIDDLLKQADMAMYKAKDAGRNRLRFFDPSMEAAVIERSSLVANLRTALAEQQLFLHYQAQVLSDGRITGAEVLTRWQHPQRGLVSPSIFIPAAEETGLILPLGQWVLEAACIQLARWAANPELAHLTLAVNVSAHQFQQADFTHQVLETISRTGANPKRLKLELTESLLVANIDEIIEKMFVLKGRGVCFSLDDFGTGYSSLSYLKRMPLDELKIDQSFVRDVLIDPNDAAIANTVVALARSLGLGVIAEGVETEAQREFLSTCGCHAYQGYLYSRPKPVEDFVRFVLSR